MSAFSPAVLLAAALAAAGPALAQEAPPAAPGSDVTVTGTPQREREREIRDFVAALTPVPATGQISRFEDALCPAVNGVTPAARTRILHRMRQVAAAIGLRVGAANCRPNMLLMLTRDKQALIREIARRYPHSFGVDRGSRPRDVAAQPGPAASWYATALVNADGRELGMFNGVFVNWAGGARQTRISSGARPTFIASAVIVEEGALNGLTTTQLADYALMRAIARVDPNRLPAPATRSILNMFDVPMGSAVPVTITRWDLGFLRGLYAGTANLRAAQQRGEITRRVAAELERPEGGLD